MGWLTGAAAAEVSGKAPATVLDELTRGLAAFWAQVPGWVPVAAHVTSWSADELYGGSYSFPAAGSPEEATEVLAAPLTAVSVNQATGDGLAADGLARDALADGVGPGGAEVPLVCFAGEATSRTHFATVGGAILSGSRAAQALLQAWGIGVAGKRAGL